MVETPTSRVATRERARSILLDLIVHETDFTFEVNDNEPTTVDDYIEDVRTAIERHLNGEVPLYYPTANNGGAHVTRD